jgi:hypothetical protein
MSSLLFPLQFKRQYSGPLDVDTVFETTSALNTYLTSALRYAGQVVTCLEQEGFIFILDNTKTSWISLRLEKSVQNITITNNTTTNVNIDTLLNGEILTFTLKIVRSNSILVIDMEVVLLPDNSTLQPNELRHINYGTYEDLNDEAITFTYNITDNNLTVDISLNEGFDAILNILKIK